MNNMYEKNVWKMCMYGVKEDSIVNKMRMKHLRIKYEVGARIIYELIKITK